jgi:hypothetical protein
MWKMFVEFRAWNTLFTFYSLFNSAISEGRQTKIWRKFLVHALTVFDHNLLSGRRFEVMTGNSHQIQKKLIQQFEENEIFVIDWKKKGRK